MKTALWTTAIIALGTVTLTCDDLDPPNSQDSRIQWDNRLFADYQYTLQIVCFCVPDFTRPVNIEVMDGLTTLVTYVDTGDTVQPGLFEPYDTIEELFDIVLDALNQEAEYIEVQYDPDLGYPSYASIDYSLSTADEELQFTVTNVAPIN